MASRSLTRRIFPYTIPVDPGTSPDAPETFQMTVPDTKLTSLELVVPTGHVGLTGIAFFYAGQQLLPWPGTANWIIAEGERFDWQLGIEVDGSVDVAAYNQGLYLHQFYVRMTLDDLILPGQQSPGAPNVVTL